MPLSIAEADINDDRGLLTTAELRAAAGVSDSSQDATLVPLGRYVSAVITKLCGVKQAGIIPPTLRLETVTETFFFKSLQKNLVLSRRPVVEIVSVTESDTELSTTDYQFDAAAGILYRKSLTGWCPNYGWWALGNTVVEYSAGYDEVPDDLKYAAIKYVQSEISQGTRDPFLKRIRIEGISEREYWVDTSKASTQTPPEVMDILRRGGYISGFSFA